MRAFADRSTSKGVFEGDLKYGRRNGVLLSSKDFVGNQNMPVAVLTLVTPRDPEVWRRDGRVKEAKRNLSNSQHSINYLLRSYQENRGELKANIHLTVGKHKL